MRPRRSVGPMWDYQVYNKGMKNKQGKKLPLHKFIATGGNPKDYKGSKNVK